MFKLGFGVQKFDVVTFVQVVQTMKVTVMHILVRPLRNLLIIGTAKINYHSNQSFIVVQNQHLFVRLEASP